MEARQPTIFTSTMRGSPREIARGRLVDALLARVESLVVVEAAAGTGKSTLLRQIASRAGALLHVGADAPPQADSQRLTLWDIPPGAQPAALPESYIHGGGRIVIAKRRETQLRGLSRAMMYGRAAHFRTADLLLTREELARHTGSAIGERLLRLSGGWPLLLGLAESGAAGEDALGTFLREELLPPLGSAELVRLKALLGGDAVISDAEDMVPFVRRDATGRLTFTAETIRAPLQVAIDAAIEARLSKPAEAREIAEAFAASGNVIEAIEAYQKAGFHELALRAFVAAHGMFLFYYHGPDAFERVLAGFPTSFATQSEALVMSLAMLACKRGDVALARRLLADRFGDTANDPQHVFSPRSVFSRDFRAFRLVMLIYEDVFFSDWLMEQIFALLPEYPGEAHLLRGSFYNSVLEYYIRSRRFAEADDLAARAHHHYERAKAPLLSFYISLHQAIMRLMMGDAVTARRHAGKAAQYLASIGFDSPNDQRLLDLLDACVEYEGGKPEPLARFLSNELDEFSHGEIWPSLIEFALQYGSQALSAHFSTVAARNFLDRWRIYQLRNRQFRNMIEIREAAVLQNGSRWHEAAEKLAALESRITRAWVLANTGELTLLQDRDEIGLALTWLRHIVFETPERAGLDEQLVAIGNNLHITDRQRIAIDLWLAYAQKRKKNLTQARSVLQKTFESAARLGAIGALAEERVFVTDLLDNRRISEFLDTSLPARQIMKKLRDTGLTAKGSGKAAGLSRRETKIMLMIAEGAANKFIANALGLSEATVKFHLGNLYRKLGCSKRQEAIAAARALGLVA
ncbi:MAG: response regulator transcription factor [Rhizobiaceae bacterium]